MGVAEEAKADSSDVSDCRTRLFLPLHRMAAKVGMNGPCSPGTCRSDAPAGEAVSPGSHS